MTSQQGPSDVLLNMLQHTRDEELDCETFAEHVAALLEDGIEDELLRRRMLEHERLCGECAEAAQILADALGIERPQPEASEAP